MGPTITNFKNNKNEKCYNNYIYLGIICFPLYYICYICYICYIISEETLIILIHPVSVM